MQASSIATSRQHQMPIAAAGVLLAVSASSFWQRHQAKQKLLALPAPERSALYHQTLATLRTVCPHATATELGEYCLDLAKFITQFPECDANCQALTRKFSPKPTK